MRKTVTIIEDESQVNESIVIMDDVTTVFFEWLLGTEDGLYVTTEEGPTIKV